MVEMSAMVLLMLSAVADCWDDAVAMDWACALASAARL